MEQEKKQKQARPEAEQKTAGRTYFMAGRPTGSWMETGKPEIGSRCEHRHRSLRAAEKCARRQEAPGFSEWIACEMRGDGLWPIDRA